MKLIKKSLFILLLIFSIYLTGCGESTFDLIHEGIESSAIDLMENEDLYHITSDIRFINGKDETLTYSWSSSNVAVINNLGKVKRLGSDINVTITLRVTKNNLLEEKEFYLRVLKDDGSNPTPNPNPTPQPDNNDYLVLQDALKESTINLNGNKSLNEVKQNLIFVSGSNKEVSYTWSSSNIFSCTSTGLINRGEKDQTVTITVKVEKDGLSLSKSFSIIVLRLDEYNENDNYTHDVIGTKSKFRPSDLNKVYENKHYNDYLDLISYIYHFKHLPDNYLTKAQAKAKGWNGSGGNVWNNESLKGCYIGGDTFRNREGVLPHVSGNPYVELDVNCNRGNRGGYRIVYNRNTFDIYYTKDHYKSFTYMIGAN